MSIIRNSFVQKQLALHVQEGSKVQNPNSLKEDSTITLYLPSRQKIKQPNGQFQNIQSLSTVEKCIKQQNTYLQKIDAKNSNPSYTQIGEQIKRTQAPNNNRTKRQDTQTAKNNKSQFYLKFANRAKGSFANSKYNLLPIKEMNQIDRIIYYRRKDVVVHIINIVERNQTYKCNFAHFLIPYSFVVLTVFSVNKDEQAYLMKIFFAIMKKLCNPDISGQIKKQRYEKYLTFLINFKTVEYHQVMAILRQFLEKQAELSKAVCPYYYNFFAFTINKDIVFGGNHNQPLVEYTINHKHPFYGGDFKQADVLVEIDQVEKKLMEEYHSKDI